MRTDRKLAAALLLALASAQAWAIQGSVKTATDTVRGEIKWQSRSKSYQISFKKGGANVDTEIPIGDVKRLDVEKPAELDRAIEAIRGGNATSAIGLLEAIVKNYKMLVWDKPAGRYLVEAYLSAGQVQKGYDSAVKIISDDKSAGWKGELAPAYWQALLKLGKTQQLESMLKKAAESGDRSSAAAALVMRGDVILAAEGDENPEACRKALIDAYLRVALMFRDEECRDARIDAMQKAANCLDKLGYASRAEEMRASARKI